VTSVVVYYLAHKVQEFAKEVAIVSISPTSPSISKCMLSAECEFVV
jgi:hypothetical protein